MTPPDSLSNGGAELERAGSGIKLTADARRVLTVLADGGKVEGRKVVPFGHRYRLYQAGSTCGETISKSAMLALIGHALLTAKPLDELCDQIDYTANDRGRDAAKRGGVAW